MPKEPFDLEVSRARRHLQHERAARLVVGAETRDALRRRKHDPPAREVEHIGIVSDEMREVVEELWPELVHKLPPKELH